MIFKNEQSLTSVTVEDLRADAEKKTALLRELARFVHARYPDTGCAIALEFKKFYMDEWTGEPDLAALPAMRGFVRHTADACRRLLHG